MRLETAQSRPRRYADGAQLLAAALAALVVVSHAILLTLLYTSLGAVVQRSHEHPFVEKMRSFTRLVADQLVGGGVIGSPRLTADLLDTVIVNGAGIHLRSELNQRNLEYHGQEDFAFGQHGDNTYFMRMPVLRSGATMELRLRYDERPTSATIAAVKRRMQNAARQIAVGAFPRN